jgi:hypothetical protein
MIIGVLLGISLTIFLSSLLALVIFLSGAARPSVTGAAVSASTVTPPLIVSLAVSFILILVIVAFFKKKHT